MSYGTGSRVQLISIPEVTYNTLPATPAMTVRRITGHTLELKRPELQSAEIRSDGQVADLRLGNYSVAGDISSELIYGNDDDLFAALLKGAWSTASTGTPETIIESTTKQTLSMESGNLDISQYRLFTGLYPDTLELDVQPGKIVTCKWGMKGNTGAVPSGTTSAGSVVAANTNSPMDSFTGTISEGGSSIAYVTGLKINFKNNDSNGPVVGSKFDVDFFPGRLEITGTLTAYVPSGVLLSKYINETYSSLQFELQGIPTNRTLTFFLPKIKYTSGSWPLSNEKAQVQTLGFYALLDVGGTGETIMITRSNN